VSKKARWERDRARAEALAQGQSVPMLAGALCGRLALDGRRDDSVGLAQLFTDAGLVDAAADATIDVERGVDLAERETQTTLAAALVLRLLADGSTLDAHRLVALFSATNVGAGDYASLVPSA